MTDPGPTATGPTATGPTATATATGEPTATGPTARGVLAGARWPVALVAALALLAAAGAVLQSRAQAGRLDPRSYTPQGSHALAALLGQRGSPVRVADTLPAATAGGRTGTTVLVPFPDALTDAELHQLAHLPGELVVVEPTATTLAALDLPAASVGDVPAEPRRPACDLPAALRAGDVVVGGPTFRATGSAASVGCYASGGSATLLRLPERRVTLLGSGEILTNGELGERGSASLALGLLGAGDDVRWLLPRTDRPVVGGRPALSELLPAGLTWAVAQLAVAAGVLALWRGRRLGRAVEEPLPVVVRAAEAVEGRGRLYRAAGARDRAAEALRVAARESSLRRVQLAGESGRAGLVAAVAARTARPAEDVDRLLYGAPPADDDALVRLADDLDLLTRTLTAAEVAAP